MSNVSIGSRSPLPIHRKLERKNAIRFIDSTKEQSLNGFSKVESIPCNKSVTPQSVHQSKS